MSVTVGTNSCVNTCTGCDRFAHFPRVSERVKDAAGEVGTINNQVKDSFRAPLRQRSDNIDTSLGQCGDNLLITLRQNQTTVRHFKENF